MNDKLIGVNLSKIAEEKPKFVPNDLQIDQMPLEEKLRAMEALWNALCRHEAVPVEQWHKDILDERRRLVEEGKAEFVDWETARSA